MKSRLFQILTAFFAGVILGVFSLFFYQQRQDDHYVHLPNFLDSVFSLQGDILSKGNINSYHKLEAVYREGYPSDILFWSMIMANKYNYPQAYEDVYYSIKLGYSLGDSSIFEMDNKTRAFALHYLQQAAAENDTNAMYEIKELKKMNIPADWLR